MGRNYCAEQFVAGRKTNNGQPTLNEQGEMTATGVVDFLAQLVLANKEARITVIEESLARLYDLRAAAEEMEEQIYNQLKVKDIAELQGKIDAITQTGLSSLSSAALSKMPLVRQMTTARNDAKLMTALRKHLLKLTQDPKFGVEYVRNLVEVKLAQVLPEGAIEHFRSGRGGAKSRVQLRFNEKVFSERKTEIFATVGLELRDDQIVGSGEAEWDDSKEDGWQLTYYPYYPWGTYGDEEKAALLSDTSLWTKFKQTVASCAPSISTTIMQQMDVMGARAFAEAGTDASNVKGVLGELYAMVVFAELGFAPQHVGNEFTREGAKLGVDVVLGSIGIQVKNYKPYQADDSHGINLRGQLTLGGFLDKLGSRSEQDKSAIGLFYAVTAYHNVASKKYQPIYNTYKNNGGRYADMLKNLYAADIDSFLPVHEIQAYDKQAQQISGSYQNAFYFVGAGEIVPVSKILTIYIKFLERIDQEAKAPRTFAANLVGGYDGDTYKSNAELVQQGQPFSFVGYDNIVGALSMQYNINLNIDYTISEMLGNQCFCGFAENSPNVRQDCQFSIQNLSKKAGVKTHRQRKKWAAPRGRQSSLRLAAEANLRQAAQNGDESPNGR